MSKVLDRLRPPVILPTIAPLPERLVQIRGEMLRYARIQLRDDSLAEDIVQDALESAIKNLDRFKGEADLKTWVIAILRNKIKDSFRARTKTQQIEIESEADVDAFMDALFDEEGSWRDECRPSSWGNPEISLCNQQFLAVLEQCLNRLPDASARAFMMREILGLETKEICEELNIKQGHCWTLLHRVRESLQLCLSQRWFSGDEGAYEV